MVSQIISKDERSIQNAKDVGMRLAKTRLPFQIAAGMAKAIKTFVTLWDDTKSRQEKVHYLPLVVAEIKEITINPLIDGDFRDALAKAAAGLLTNYNAAGLRSTKQILAHMGFRTDSDWAMAKTLTMMVFDYLLTHGEDIVKEAEKDQEILARDDKDFKPFGRRVTYLRQ